MREDAVPVNEISRGGRQKQMSHQVGRGRKVRALLPHNIHYR
jgi:hypothetical protein